MKKLLLNEKPIFYFKNHLAELISKEKHRYCSIYHNNIQIRFNFSHLECQYIKMMGLLRSIRLGIETDQKQFEGSIMIIEGRFMAKILKTYAIFLQNQLNERIIIFRTFALELPDVLYF
jgi:hypothetical protein